jgi:hypothetical protein
VYNMQTYRGSGGAAPLTLILILILGSGRLHDPVALPYKRASASVRPVEAGTQYEP